MELRQIEKYPGYSIDSSGTVYSHLTTGPGRGTIDCDRLRILRPACGRGGKYLQHTLRNRDPAKSGRSGYLATVPLHVLVCEAFHGPRPGPKYVVRHLDDNQSDNRAENLSWGTYSENARDATINGKRGSGIKSSSAKLSSLEEIRAVFVLKNLGVDNESIAAVFGCGKYTIMNILAGRKYKRELALLK